MDTIGAARALSAFAGKRVFITGHTGFKGSWLTFLLAEAGAEVMGYALAPEDTQSHFSLLGLDRRIEHLVADVRDADSLASSMAAFRPEFVFHLAAQALVRRSYDAPALTFETNVMGTVNLLEAVRTTESVRSLVCVTSDKCYDNVEWIWGYRENDRLGGRDPYSASKAAAEMAFAAYAGSFFADRRELGTATARAGNVIGGGDWSPDRIVPDCVRATEAGAAIELRHPAATRPWQHVLEPVSGYVLLAARLRENPAAYAGAWNFGPSTSEARTVEEVARSIVGHLGSGRVALAPQTPNQHEAQLLQLNCDKAHQLLGWHPRWHVEKALAATGEWYRLVRQGQSAEVVTRAQLHEYFPELA